jgi:hypothetical protein
VESLVPRFFSSSLDAEKRITDQALLLLVQPQAQSRLFFFEQNKFEAITYRNFVEQRNGTCRSEEFLKSGDRYERRLFTNSRIQEMLPLPLPPNPQ